MGRSLLSLHNFLTAGRISSTTWTDLLGLGFSVWASIHAAISVSGSTRERGACGASASGSARVGPQISGPSGCRPSAPSTAASCRKHTSGASRAWNRDMAQTRPDQPLRAGFFRIDRAERRPALSLPPVHPRPRRRHAQRNAWSQAAVAAELSRHPAGCERASDGGRWASAPCGASPDHRKRQRSGDLAFMQHLPGCRRLKLSRLPLCVTHEGIEVRCSTPPDEGR